MKKNKKNKLLLELFTCFVIGLAASFVYAGDTDLAGRRIDKLMAALGLAVRLLKPRVRDWSKPKTRARKGRK